MENTTPAQENYVETIYALSKKGPVRPSALASQLGVKRASVSKFIRTLAAKGLVDHQLRGEILLTDAGKELAEAILRRDRCLTQLLVEVCNMPEEEADPEVHRLEHLISDEVLYRLEALVDFACSSKAWLKRLHLRIESETPTPSDGIMVGRSTVHQGSAVEKGS
jgi:DtxR family Mn-dependent transcriptional regulator